MKLLDRIVSTVALFTALTLLSAPSFAMLEVLSPDEVFVDNSQFTIISSKRTGRTTKEFVLKGNLINITDKKFENVEAQLVGIPAGVTIIGSDLLNFGSLFGSDTYQSMNTITLSMNLRVRPNLNDLGWQVSGNQEVVPPPPPPPPPTPSPSEVGTFMSIDNNAIEGEVDNKSHKGWISLLAWSQGLNAQVSELVNGPGGSNRNLLGVSYGQVSITKFLDSTSTELRKALLQGEQYDEIKIDVIASCDGNLYTQYAITLVNGIFSSAVESANIGTEKMVENLSIDVTRIETIYVPVTEDCMLRSPILSYQDMTF